MTFFLFVVQLDAAGSYDQMQEGAFVTAQCRGILSKRSGCTFYVELVMAVALFVLLIGYIVQNCMGDDVRKTSFKSVIVK